MEKNIFSSFSPMKEELGVVSHRDSIGRHLLKKENRVFYGPTPQKVAEEYSSPTIELKDTKRTPPSQRLHIRIASPGQICALRLRRGFEALFVGRVWNPRTIDYISFTPVSGGLFCESSFGSLQRGICACKRVRWRSYPKLQEKLKRFEILSCSVCLSKTIFPIFSVSRSLARSYFTRESTFYSKSNDSPHQKTLLLEAEKILSTVPFFFEFLKVITRGVKGSQNVRMPIIACECESSELHISRFSSVLCSCRYCITATKVPSYGKFLSLLDQKQEKNLFSSLLNLDYQPGFCRCGRTSTEIPWYESTFCGYCGATIAIRLSSRRYRFSYLPLSLPVAHFFYYHYEPWPILRLTGFSHRLFSSILRDERAVAEEVFIHLNLQDKSYFSAVFQPSERITSSISTHTTSPSFKVFTTTSNGASVQSEKDSLSIFESHAEANYRYSSVLTKHSLVLPKFEVLTFPWYCLYRDTPFTLVMEKKKEDVAIRDIEMGLDRLFATPATKLDHPFYPLHALGMKGSSRYPRTSQLNEKLGVIRKVCWISRGPVRSGRELLLNRLQALNQKDWCLQARCNLRVLKKDVESFIGLGSLVKYEILKYRRLIRTRSQILVRMRIIVGMQRSRIQFHWLILECLPILPPDLRPVLSLEEERILVSDVNILYQRVIERNSRVAQMQRLIRTYGRYSMRDLHYHECLLQESLECLFENRVKGKKSETDSKQRVYKSLAQILKGKRGRFRNNLLGKRVDYSGRSVIVSGPNLALHHCGLPRIIVITLFQPFLIRFLVGRIQIGLTNQTLFQSRQFIDQRTDERRRRGRLVLSRLPVLLNRAPTLHRLSFQTFQPQLSYRQSIQLHPLVCAGFNADFDGDQIAVHVPLFQDSRSEAWTLIIPGSHLFSPSVGELAFLPSQDIVLGAYYMTTQRSIFLSSRSAFSFPNFRKRKEIIRERETPLLFAQIGGVLRAFERGGLKLHHFLWIYIQTPKILDREREKFFLMRRLDRIGREQKYSTLHWGIKKPAIQLVQTTIGRVIFSSSFSYRHRKPQK
jgi:hypothetical protein